jgi:hypothetical protein
MNNNIPPKNIVLKLEELNSWRNQRVEQYGQIGNQLNLLWDDIDAGLLGDKAKTGAWYLHIKSIKTEIKKPDIVAIEKDLQKLFDQETGVQV